MAATRSRKSPSKTVPLSPWLYIGVGVLVCALVFIRLTDTETPDSPGETATEGSIAKQKEQPQQSVDDKPTAEKLAATDKDITQDTPTEAPEAAQDTKKRTKAYVIPESLILQGNSTLVLGESASLQFNSKVVTVSYENRALDGERLYRLEVTGLERSRHTTFSSYDSLSAFHIADLNANAMAEVYLIWISDGSGSYGSIQGYEIQQKDFKPMVLPQNIQRPGYRGHDEFVVYPDYIEHSYPVYRQNDPNSNNSGGIEYHKYTFRENSYKAVEEK